MTDNNLPIDGERINPWIEFYATWCNAYLNNEDYPITPYNKLRNNNETMLLLDRCHINYVEMCKCVAITDKRFSNFFKSTNSSQQKYIGLISNWIKEMDDKDKNEFRLFLHKNKYGKHNRRYKVFDYILKSSLC